MEHRGHHVCVRDLVVARSATAFCSASQPSINTTVAPQARGIRIDVIKGAE